MQRAFSIESEHGWNGEANAALFLLDASDIEYLCGAAGCHVVLRHTCSRWCGPFLCLAAFFVLCSVGIKPPGIEVRFKDIFIETSVYTNVSRNLPSILNAYRGAVEVSGSVFHTSHAGMSSHSNCCLLLGVE